MGLVPTSPAILGLGKIPQPNSTFVFGPSLISETKDLTRTDRTACAEHRSRS
ncbi:hypothetical protein SCLCIDRAFT_1206880 [Scleroderma citrinum Foug A]|uniref:Uncharacterized protein n=1 Tax=Scleroderma citrinum Foug A TaxID=1036808 RepID=A0A0C3B0E0_9AGAM|nr:hypothetical protein SCLCIDRAFT_1206880 [Scleroderma citrinum Foug A]